MQDLFLMEFSRIFLPHALYHEMDVDKGINLQEAWRFFSIFSEEKDSIRAHGTLKRYKLNDTFNILDVIFLDEFTATIVKQSRRSFSSHDKGL